jgi:prolyl-tRNA synthetase
MIMSDVLTARATDFSRWYQDLIVKAKLADNGPVRGTMIIRPVGYAIWERMQAEMDKRIKALDVQNAYFPLFIPDSYLRREAEHIEGFSPELAVVTHAGGIELDEPVIVRPTSETVIGESMAKWTQSYRDLPLLLNQWSNVVRWELRPRLFLRTTEFLWQEGHTAHMTEEDALKFAHRILHEVYEDFMVSVLGIPVVVGRKTERERFAGAINTLTAEAMTGDGKALQLGTSHELGQNFARAFTIDYLSAAGRQELCWTTSWGSSTRMIGGLIMVHGDDDGLRVPPRLAPVQVWVTAVKEDDDGIDVIGAAVKVRDMLRDAGFRVALDTRTEVAFGRRVIDAELMGYPVRIEVGPRDVARGEVVFARRFDGTKTSIPVGKLTATVSIALDEDQQRLHDAAKSMRIERTENTTSLDDAIEAASVGWARIPWAKVGIQGEAKANDMGVTVRCLVREDGSVPLSEDEPELLAILARAY